MTRIFLFVFWVLSIQCCLAQDSPPDNSNPGVDQLIKEQAAGKDSLLYTNADYGYSIVIPAWLRISQSPAGVFGGIFPKVDAVENALAIKAFKKVEVGSMDNFEKWVIRDYIMGQSPRWDADTKVLLKKKLTDFGELGNAWKVQLIWEGNLYDCCYILTETSKGYVWIDFTSTSATYPVNFEKFKQLVSLFKRL